MNWVEDKQSGARIDTSIYNMKITCEVREREEQTDNLPTVSPLAWEKINHWLYLNEREALESQSCITKATSWEQNTNTHTTATASFFFEAAQVLWMKWKSYICCFRLSLPIIAQYYLNKSSITKALCAPLFGLCKTLSLVLVHISI